MHGSSTSIGAQTLAVPDPGERGDLQGNVAVATAIDVCICTYHRASVVDTLRAVAAQDVGDEIRVRVIVADNALYPHAQSLVFSAAAEVGLDVLYVHAPANNISIARNACLELIRADWMVFLDDDEMPSPEWLNALLHEARRGEWDAILGPVQATYPEAVADWVRRGDFHSTRPVWVGGRIETGYTGNVMIRGALIANSGLRFREELGRTGGEDVDFFYRLRATGGKIGFARDALAYESVPRERTTLSWLLKRSFRAGQTHGAHLRALRRGVGGICLAAAKALACGIGACLWFWKTERRNRFLTRAALHVGVAARMMGVAEIKLY